MNELEKETISVNALKKMPLEERAQFVLRNYANGEVKIKGEESLLSFQPCLDAWAYLENNNFVELVGGTPKSGASYKITRKGVLFMDEAI